MNLLHYPCIHVKLFPNWPPLLLNPLSDLLLVASHNKITQLRLLYILAIKKKQKQQSHLSYCIMHIYFLASKTNSLNLKSAEKLPFDFNGFESCYPHRLAM